MKKIILCLALLVSVPACGDEPKRDTNFGAIIMDPPPTAGTGAGTMQAPPMSTMPATPDAGADAGPVAAAACAHEGPPVMGVSGLALCPACTSGHCLPNSAVPDSVDKLVDSCDDKTTCVPDLAIETGGKFSLDTCKSLQDADGRCASKCFPAVAALASILPDKGCGPDELCMPCFDPSTGDETGFCGLSCDDDSGGDGEPVVLSPCCEAADGSCQPASGVDAAQELLFSQGDCADTDRVCVPAAFSASSAEPPATCLSLLGAEGRCAPDCLGVVEMFGGGLPQDTCAAGESCAPCFHPVDGQSTGVCDLGSDAPVMPATLYTRCCPHTPPGGVATNLASCVPVEVVPDAWEASQRQETCPAMHMCVPDTSAKTLEYEPPMCNTDGTFGVSIEGVCVNDCFVHGVEQSASPQSTCVEEKRCGPCRDPGNQPTGVCPHDPI